MYQVLAEGLSFEREKIIRDEIVASVQDATARQPLGLDRLGLTRNRVNTYFRACLRHNARARARAPIQHPIEDLGKNRRRHFFVDRLVTRQPSHRGRNSTLWPILVHLIYKMLQTGFIHNNVVVELHDELIRRLPESDGSLRDLTSAFRDDDPHVLCVENGDLRSFVRGNANQNLIGHERSGVQVMERRLQRVPAKRGDDH